MIFLLVLLLTFASFLNLYHQCSLFEFVVGESGCIAMNSSLDSFEVEDFEQETTLELELYRSKFESKSSR